MKPVFGTNRDDRKSEADNSAAFMTKQPSEELMAEYDEAMEKISAADEKAENLQSKLRERKKMKLALSLGAAASGLVLLVELVSGTFAQTMRDNPKLLTTVFVYLAIYAVYMFYLKRQEQRTLPENEPAPAEPTPAKSSGLWEDLSRDLKDPRIKEADRKLYDFLGVPDVAPEVDVLHFDYQTENGEPVLQKKNKPIEFFNLPMRIFVENESLCLCGTDARYEFPLSGMRPIKTLRGDCKVLLWNKDTPCDDAEFCEYALQRCKDGAVAFDTYHVLEFERDGEVYGLYFPCYELYALQTLGL